ncbi:MULTISPECIES: hypothetical protein [Mammaliicoccus]|nr:MULTISPECIES: hypothetical protein [Mammaliicoccus]
MKKEPIQVTEEKSKSRSNTPSEKSTVSQPASRNEKIVNGFYTENKIGKD